MADARVTARAEARVPTTANASAMAIRDLCLVFGVNATSRATAKNRAMATKAGVTEKYGANHGKFYSESYDTELDKS